jgi:hypothetical protein
MDTYYILIRDKNDYKPKTYTCMTRDIIREYEHKDKYKYYGEIRLLESSKVKRTGYNIFTTNILKIIKIGYIDELLT